MKPKLYTPPKPAEFFVVNEKLTLHKNDKIKIRGGPYYVSNDGTHSSMGESGMFTFAYAADNGFMAFSKEEKTLSFIYMGPTIMSTNGIIREAHKVKLISKARE